MLNMDAGRVTALTLLDLLSTWYGIDGIALDWFVSYLSDREQKVKLMDCLSSPAEVTIRPRPIVIYSLHYVAK